MNAPPQKALRAALRDFGGGCGYGGVLWLEFCVQRQAEVLLDLGSLQHLSWHLSMLRIFSSLKIIVTNKRKLLLKQYIGFDPFFDCSYFSFHSILLELPLQYLAFDLRDPCQSQHKTDLK